MVNRDSATSKHDLIATQIVAHLRIVNFPEWLAGITGEKQLIGRGKEAHLRLPPQFRSASRKHAQIWADKRDLLWICDLDSRMGTTVNGVLLAPHRENRVIPGDRILIGAVELELRSGHPAANAVNTADKGSIIDMESTRAEVRTTSAARLGQRLELLTAAEVDVVLWLTRGYTDLDEIGQLLHRSPHTVRTQLGSIFRKADVHSREELLGWIRRGSVPDHFGNGTK
jgi:DNA-binding CsgD family transcriptional regulator